MVDERFRYGKSFSKEKREEVLEKAIETLLELKDPDTSQRVLAHVIRTDKPPEDSEFKGRGRGDLFLSLKSGYSMGETFHKRALLPSHLSGHHQQLPGLRAHHANFDALGPLFSPGKTIGLVNHRDIHETALRLLGLPQGDGGGELLTQALLEEENS